MDIKRLNAQTTGQASADRFRMLISDGVHYMQAMLATQLNALVISEEIAARSVVRLDEFICNNVHDRQIAIILGLSSMGPPQQVMFGNPVAIEKPGAGAPAGGAAPTAQPLAQANYVKPQAPPVAPSSNPYQQPQQQQQQQQFQPTAAAPPSRAPQQAFQMQRAPVQHDANLFPLKALNPYQNQRWTVKARVVHKSDVKTWNNDKGSGRLLSVDILDAEGTKMRVTMFNQEIDNFEPLLQVGKSIYLSKAQVKVANKKFNNLGTDYELTLDKSTIIEPAPDASDIPLQTFKFTSIADLNGYAADRIVDVIGYVKEVGDLQQINTKRGSQLSKRNVTLVDSSMASIELTMWGKHAETVNPEGILAVQGAKVSDWNAKTLGTTQQSLIESNPDLPEAHKLRAWYLANRDHLESVTQLTQQGVRPQQADNAAGPGGQFKPAQYKTFGQIRDEGLGRKAEPDFFLLNATVSSIKHDRDVWYNACKQCKKKVVEAAGAGGWVCEKCNQTFVDCDRRYILRVTACDHTGSYWLNAFNEQGEAIVGYPAQQIAMWKETQSPEYEKAFGDALFREFTMKVKAKEDSYQGENRVQVTVNQCNPLNYAEQTKRLQELIAAYQQIGYVPDSSLKFQ